MHEKLQRFKLNLIVERDPNLRWCPRVGCTKYVRRAGMLATTATCECGQEVCMKCGAVAHRGVRCVNVGNNEFNEWARQNNVVLKPCPNCKISTWKYDGCNHIKCKRCEYHWCYLCFAKVTSYGHYRKLSLYKCPGHTFAQ